MRMATRGPRDCKVVFRELFGNDEASSLNWFGQSIEILKASPQTCGLPQFVTDVERLVAVLALALG